MAASMPQSMDQIQDAADQADSLMNGGNTFGELRITDDLVDDLNDWGFALTELYKLAATFHKEKEGKALHLSYDEKLKLVARSQQILHGPCSEQAAAPPVGYLDVIGRDRRQAWQALGDMSKEEAMRGFIQILDASCPIFRPYVEAHKRDLEERERLIRAEEERIRRQTAEDEEQKRAEEETRHLQQLELRRLEMQRQQIQEALNQQTCYQFKAYAEQQFPNDTEQQLSLIRQLQEQHYQQYVQQVYQQQQLDRQQKMSKSNAKTVNTSSQEMNQSTPNHHGHQSEGGGTDDDIRNGSAGDEESNCSNSGSSNNSQTSALLAVKPASMWTRKDIVEFKRSITKEEGCGDSVINVNHGETVTVRVPTHEDGTCLFWEFATDGYDIGFGVYFEWTETPDTQVSVHVSESEDDEGEEDDEGVGEDVNAKNGDVERGGRQLESTALDTGEHSPPLTVIIPIYRRDCHEEVYAGSHVYPGQGVYLLKFDNSYSLWRSKLLYYRVYYTH